MAKQRLNHSRYLDYYAKDIGDSEYHRAKATPTEKQVKFRTRLLMMCLDNNIDVHTGYPCKTRADYARNIDELIQRLLAGGIDVHGNGKDAGYVVTVGQDRRGRLYTGESIRLCAENAPTGSESAENAPEGGNGDG